MAIVAAENSLAFWRALAARDPAAAVHTLRARVAALSPRDRRAIWAYEPDPAALVAEFARGVATGGPLAGIPFAVKDLFDVAGLPTGAGSTFLGRVRGPAAADAPIVAHLRRAGAVFAGKVHLHEFAYGLTGENPHFGDGPNLRWPGHVSGGSSSGSAAAVAGGMVPFALGTDTGGSVRVPAAFNGLWGFRARPLDAWIAGCFPLSPSFDTAGWFTTSAPDLRELQHAVYENRRDPHATDRLLFAFLPARELAPEMSDDFARAMETAAASFATALPAAELAELRRALDGALEAYVVIQSAEAAAVHAPWLEAYRAQYDPVVWRRIEAGRQRRAEAIAAAHAKQAEVRAVFDALLARYAGVVLPAAPFPALTKAECTDENRTRILRLTHPASLAGRAVTTIPIPLAGGRSGGLQVILRDETIAADGAWVDTILPAGA